MDFMFEDEADEVGSDVEAYCPKCKADTTHVVISKYEDEIRRVQCNPCGDVHSFRKPRGEVEEEVPEPVAARKRAAMKKASWEEFFAKHNERNAKPYEFRDRYKDNAMVTHPKFGVGFVSEVVSDSKVEITFKDARRILVHNRKDIQGAPLAAEGDGIPTPPKAPAPAPKPAKTAAKDPVKAVPASAKDTTAAAPAPVKEAAKEAPVKETPPSKVAKEPPAAKAKEPAAAKPKDAPVAKAKAPTSEKTAAPAAKAPAKAEKKADKVESKAKPAAPKAAAKPVKGKDADKSDKKKPAAKPAKAAAKKPAKKK